MGNSLGSAALALAFLTAVFAVVAALIGRHGDQRWIDTSRRAVYALCALLTLCVVVIEIAFASNDFSFNIVQQHSSIETPTFYKLAAMWSSQEGSLLLWAWVLSIASSIALYTTRDKLRELVPYATAVMMGVASFFVGLMLFAADVNPFATLSPARSDGVGLNPLLQHPSMMIHPPMLYSGYVAFTIPFAFAVGALIARRLDSAWIRATRRFALVAWAFLGFGLLLGARWSYTELGWGGYWAWDPVENAALMPWLLGTAFLHSIMVQEKRGMLKVWNACLVVGTFSLALLGTFLVRSGVLQSIHAFGDNTVGPYILGLIAVVLIGSTALIVSRLDELRSAKRIDSLASREAVFLVNNLLLVALCAVVFWGTFFPLISELFTGNKASLAAPWFDRYTTPLAILLVLFTGIGPLLAWRRVSWASAKRVFVGPAVFAAAVGVLLALATDAARKPWALCPLRLRGLRPLRPGPGVLAGGRRAPQDRRGVHTGLDACGHLPQPAPLRRLPGPRRHRGPADRDRRLFELPDQPRREAEAGAERRRRRAHHHLRAPDGRRQQRGLHLRRCPQRAQGRQAVRRPAPNPALLPPDRGADGDDRQLLRRRGDQRGRPQGRRRQRPLDRRAAGHRSGAASRRRRRSRLSSVRQRRPRDAAAMSRGGSTDEGGRRKPTPASPGPDSDQQPPGRYRERDRQDLPARRLDRHLPRHRQPARDLDVDWRSDRHGGCPDRYLADPGRASPPGRGLRSGTGRPRPIPGLSEVEVVFGVALLALLAAFVLRPLWGGEAEGGGEDPRVADLEARKEVKYREIRDTELDHAAGKLSDEDFRRQEAELRGEAAEILRDLDELRAAG